MAFYGAASIDQLTERWRAEWNDHHCRVTEFFAGKPHRFFVCPIRLTFLTSSTTCFRNASSTLSIIGWRLKRPGDNTYPLSPPTYPRTEMRVSQVRFLYRTALLVAQAGSPTEQDCARY